MAVSDPIASKNTSTASVTIFHLLRQSFGIRVHLVPTLLGGFERANGRIFRLLQVSARTIDYGGLHNSAKKCDGRGCGVRWFL